MSDHSELVYKYEPEMPEKQKGLYIDGIVYLNQNLEFYEESSTIAEEIGHHETTVGDISVLDTIEKQKQEQRARDFGATLLVTPQDFVDCFKAGLQTLDQCAYFLEITRQALDDAITVYAKYYDEGLRYQNYRIIFRKNGTIGILEFFE